MATLVFLQGGEAIPYPLTSDDTTLGRHPDCTIQLQSNMVSRKHAQVTRDGDEYFLEDYGSGNGSYVNGRRITEKTLLKNEDRIKLGPLLFRFESGQPAPSLPETADFASTTSRRFGANFDLDIASGDEDSATIVGAVETQTGFGLLDVQPEVKLKAVLEISRSLVGAVELESLLPKLLETLFSIFPHADRGSILLKDEATGEMVPAAQKHRRASEDATVRLSRTILNKVLEDRTGVLSADAASDDRFDASESISNLTIRSMMCVPLLSMEGEPMGIINIDTQNPLNQFRRDDLDLLMAVAGQAALCYESTRLLSAYVAKQKQDNELDIARNVQRALLPEKLPQVEGYQFFASYDAAQAVGGDYYDCFLLDANTICLSFGDVAGKGVPGALIMSRIASVVQCTVPFVRDVQKAITVINNHMCAHSVDGRFVTYVLVIINLKTHRMSLVNAGHMSPLIRCMNGDVEEFNEESIGIPIGIMEDYPYEAVERTINPGETVVIVTDGVDEAMNPAGELYTKERVTKFVATGSPIADQLGKDLLADVRKHANGRPQNDDITIMTFGRNPL